MHQSLQTQHDFASHTLRFNGRIKGGTQSTKDQIRWVRSRLDANLSTIAKRMRFDTNIVQQLRPMPAN